MLSLKQARRLRAKDRLVGESNYTLQSKIPLVLRCKDMIMLHDDVSLRTRHSTHTREKSSHHYRSLCA